jgi:hypothetical protein
VADGAAVVAAGDAAGLADTSLRVVDITKPEQPVALTQCSAAQQARHAAIGVAAAGTATLYAFTEARTIPAEDVFRISLRVDTRKHADLVVIAHPSMLAAVEPLLALRRSQGLSVAAGSTCGRTYDEFASGSGRLRDLGLPQAA